MIPKTWTVGLNDRQTESRMKLKGVLKKREIGWYVCVHYISFQSLFTCGGGGERERERENLLVT